VGQIKLSKAITRFGGFPALKVGNLHFVWGFSKRKFGIFHPNGVETKNGRCDLVGLNVGRFMLLYEAPAKLTSDLAGGLVCHAKV
jgi:hypothetical protein